MYWNKFMHDLWNQTPMNMIRVAIFLTVLIMGKLIKPLSLIYKMEAVLPSSL